MGREFDRRVLHISASKVFPRRLRHMTNRRKYPWSVLEIDPTTNEADIKRAYAAKLKVTRPDDDPDGFQKLVTARDAALARRKMPSRPKNTRKSRAKSAARVAAVEKKLPDEEHNNRQPPLAQADRAARLDRVSDIDFDVIQNYLYTLQNDDLYFDALTNTERLGLLSIDEKAAAEERALAAVSSSIATVLLIRNSTVLQVRQAYLDRRKIVEKLDDYFGWSAEDSRTRQLLMWDNPDFPDQLQLLLHPERHRRAVPTAYRTRYSWSWWTIIIACYVAIRVIGVFTGHHP